MNTAFGRLCLLPRGGVGESSGYGKYIKKPISVRMDDDSDDDDDGPQGVIGDGESGSESAGEGAAPKEREGAERMQEEDPDDEDMEDELPHRKVAANDFAAAKQTFVKVTNNLTPNQEKLLRGLGTKETAYGRRTTEKTDLENNGAMIIAWRNAFTVNMAYKKETYSKLMKTELELLEGLKDVTTKEQKWLIQASNATPYMVAKSESRRSPQDETDKEDANYDPSKHADKDDDPDYKPGKTTDGEEPDGKKRKRQAATKKKKEKPDEEKPKEVKEPPKKVPGDDNWSIFESLKDSLLSKLRIVKTFEQILEAVEYRVGGMEPHYNYDEQMAAKRNADAAEANPRGKSVPSNSKDPPFPPPTTFVFEPSPPKGKGKKAATAPARSSLRNKAKSGGAFDSTRIKTFQYPDMRPFWHNDSIWWMRDELVEALQRLSDFSGQPVIVDAVCEIVLAFINNPAVIQKKFMNFMITGEAGTGKTTIASYISDVFVAAGLFVRKGFREVGRTDFIAGYEGQTAQKTLDFLITNLDYGVVFLDEAYALTKWHDGKPEAYGDEAMSGIVQFFTKYKGLTCMITAGYEKEMRRYFLPTNPGLSRRIPYQFAIRDYSAPELINILKLKTLEMLNYGKPGYEDFPLPERLDKPNDADHLFTPGAFELLRYTIENGMSFREESMALQDTYDPSTRKYYPYEKFRRPQYRFLYEVFKNQAGAMTNLAEAEIVPLISTTVKYNEIVPEVSLNVPEQIARRFMDYLPGRKIGLSEERRPSLTMQDMCDCIVKRIERIFLSEADEAVIQFAGLVASLMAKIRSEQEVEKLRRELQESEASYTRSERPPTPAKNSDESTTPATETPARGRATNREEDRSPGEDSSSNRRGRSRSRI